MKAAVVHGVGMTPVYGDFERPSANNGEVLVSVRAAAMSNLTKARASGSHYSAAGIFPAVAGTDGVGITPDGRRVYFAMPEAPFGALAEFCPIHERRCVAIPDDLDDVTAAAIANPGMSAWAGLVERAKLVRGETVLINGATSTAGRVALQLARYLGAEKIIGTARNASELEEVKSLGVDVVVPFHLDEDGSAGAKEFEEALKPIFQQGIDVVLDYLWGDSARTILSALAKTIEDNPVRFIHVGAASGQDSISLPGAVLRSAAIEMMGSGIGSVGRKQLVESISRVFEAVGPAGIRIATREEPLSRVKEVWESAGGKPRVVFTIA